MNGPTSDRVIGGRTTGIGSLPHLDVESAIDFAFRFDLPFCPELPKAEPADAMIARALSDDLRPVAWSAFVDRLRSEARREAKLQVAGPVTLARWTPDWSARARKTWHRALVEWVEELASVGAAPWLFFDEPSLAKATPETWTHLEDALDQARSAGARTGVHCCGEVPWAEIFGLSVDVISFDACRGLPPDGPELSAHLGAGRGLAVGIVDTSSEALALCALQARWPEEQLFWTPACGLAGRTEEECPQALRMLQEGRSRFSERRSPGRSR